MLLPLLPQGSGGGSTTRTNYGLLLALTSEVSAPTTNYALLLALTSEGASAPPPSTTNYALLLALTSEQGGTPPPIMTPKVGMTPAMMRRKQTQTTAEFEAGKPKPFGRRWFEEFKAAEKAAQTAAEEAPKRAAKKHLKRAAEAAAEVRREAELAPPAAGLDFAPIAHALSNAVAAKKLKDTIEETNRAIALSNAILAKIKAAQDDEDEALTLLMLH